MRVLLWMPTALEIPGGHKTQAVKTCAALREMGVEANLEECSDLPSSHAAADIVHGFGSLSREAMRTLRAKAIPIALSTIYFSRRYLWHGFTRRWTPRAAARKMFHSARFMRRSIREGLLETCDGLLAGDVGTRLAFEAATVLLPNSHMEALAIQAELNTTTPCVVVPNAVDLDQFASNNDAGATDRRGVISVGRIEPHKNQLGVIRACRKLGLPLTIVGPVHPHHHSYADECRTQCKRYGFEMLPQQTASHLAVLYRRHKVHVLASWFETTGLVSLEAAVCGCNVVTTDRGFAREYFGSDAWYCDPANEESLLRAVSEAHRVPVGPMLASRVRASYTWKQCAEATLKGYERALARCLSGRVCVSMGG